VLILGSGPDALRCRGWDLSVFDARVAINNAWAVRDDWTHCIHPDDFPEERRPTPGAGQRLVTSDEYVPAQNRFGGVVYAGATMAFTASYWVLDALRPERIAYLGCDMVYDQAGATHFYGDGTADPLRDDPTLQSLEAKARRLQAFASRAGCALVNLSEGRSRLPYPRGDLATVRDVAIETAGGPAVEAALALEEDYGLVVASGRYWEESDRVDPARLSEIDAAWLRAYTDGSGSESVNLS
jgi:hypothetical protein